MKTLIHLAVLVGLASPLSAQTAVDLFNGKDLSGWVQRGGVAKYAVEGNEIVGTSVLNTPNSFLCTEKTYGDFILEFEFKVDARLNSGVQFRSECFDSPKEMQHGEKVIKIAAGRVHGYQAEIDPDLKRGRMWSAGIYDEGRRGWLYPAGGDKAQAKAFTEQGVKTFKPEAWNQVKIEARGDSIKTWLNGESRADLKDSLTSRGFIALQVHGIGKNQEVNGSQVRWRNLKLTDLTPPANPATNGAKPAAK